MKKIASCFKTGLIVVIPFGVCAFLLAKVWYLAVNGVKFFDKEWLNGIVGLALILIFIVLIGLLFRLKKLRNAIHCRFERIPIVSTILHFLPKGDEINSLKDGKLKEVLFECYPGIYFRGVLTLQQSWKFPDGKKLCRVFVSNSPAGVTGNVWEVEESKIIETGRTMKEYFASVMTYGARNSNPR